MYTWLYYNQSERGYMCKVCEVYYGNSPHSSGSNRGAWSHVGVKFNDNPGEKIRRHKKSSYHNKAVLAITNLKIQDTIEKSNEEEENRKSANKMYVGKLIRIIHLLARNNLSVKSLYPKMIEFLSEELEEPIIKQYLDYCPKNATYTSHETCDSLLSSLDSFFWEQTRNKISRSADIVLFADEASNAARSEMLGVFLSYFDEGEKKFGMDFVLFVEVSSI